MVLGFEGSEASYEFVNGDSQNPNFHSFVVTVADVDLGGEVKVSSDDSRHVSAHSPRKGPLQNPEVDYFYYFLPDISWPTTGLSSSLDLWLKSIDKV